MLYESSRIIDGVPKFFRENCVVIVSAGILLVGDSDKENNKLRHLVSLLYYQRAYKEGMLLSPNRSILVV